MSLHQYFDYKKTEVNNYSRQIRIPNYVGGKIESLYPLVGSETRSLLMVYTPWLKAFPYEGKDNACLIQLFEKFVSSAYCPPSLKYEYDKSKHTYFCDLKQPTSNIEPLLTYINEASLYNTNAEDIIGLTSLLPCNFDNSQYGLEQ